MLLRKLVQHLVIIPGVRILQFWIAILVQCASGVQRWIVTDEVPDDPCLKRVILSDLWWNRTSPPLLKPSLYDSAASYDIPISVEI